ncbi:MAG: hypothetical protein PHN84_14305 [Desulfuromonadaceae bacterium]|jgi:flagellar motor switch protein FliG|nr:hypothetical protein [Desulfuromonadaceae bacterium]MDD2855969.1 hypothetical protein [Desulfuromonadaceae bacterium]
MNYRLITKRLLEEHPQTMAIAIAQLPDEHAQEVMKLLPAFMQAEILSRISNLSEIPVEILAEVKILLYSVLK